MVKRAITAFPSLFNFYKKFYGDTMVVIKTLLLHEKYGYGVGNIDISNELFEVVKILGNMTHDGIIKNRFHFECKDNRTIKLDTYGMKDKHVKELKEILKNKGFYIEENSCYHWLSISEDDGSLEKYFK